ncbi:transposase [Hymenobacter elongatus]|uniref:Transposase n=1 Tax=Hymenobacter elongatus TaxID=877208 RepID=A0A4Z0PDZ6_9BACT|nr:transposase [Hymenobacter elongatus]
MSCSRQCLAIHVGQSLKGADVVAVGNRLQQALGVAPERIQVDNGSEVLRKARDKRAYEQQVTLDFSRPGKPTDNSYSKPFQRQLPAGVFERALIFVADRCAVNNRAVAAGIQRLPAPSLAG